MAIRTYISGGSGRIVTIKTGSDADNNKREEITQGYTDKPLSSF